MLGRGPVEGTRPAPGAGGHPEGPRTSAPAVSGFGGMPSRLAVRRAKGLHHRGRHHAGGALPAPVKPYSARPHGALPQPAQHPIRPLHVLFRLADFHVVGASPEILNAARGDTVTVRPIAGTRNGASQDEDVALAAELLADERSAPNTSNCSISGETTAAAWLGSGRYA